MIKKTLVKLVQMHHWNIFYRIQSIGKLSDVNHLTWYNKLPEHLREGTIQVYHQVFYEVFTYFYYDMLYTY